jgi:hypothetical protein
MKLDIAFVHYIFGTKGGVNSVVFANAKALLDIHKDATIFFVGSIKSPLIERNSRVHHIDVPELDISKEIEVGFVEKNVFDYMREGLKIYRKLKKILKDKDVIIFENPNLAANPPATYAFYLLAKKLSAQDSKTKVVFRTHDFVEDRDVNFNNILKFTGVEEGPYWHKILFPKLRNIRYVIINSTDRKRLWGHGIVEEGLVHYIPNPINEVLMHKDNGFPKKLRGKLVKKYNLKKNTKFIFYPVRIVSRKNIEEAIFLTMLLRHLLGENYWLVISLRTGKKIDDDYASTLDNYVKKHKLPVILGINEYVGLMRKITPSGELKHFGISDAYSMSDFVISTSILEGFGLFFIESWFFHKLIIGRDLPYVTEDFKKAGINLQHLYTNLIVNGKDFKDYTIAQKFSFISRLSSPKFLNQVIEENKHSLIAIQTILNEVNRKQIIRKNRKVVLKTYGQRKIARKIIDIAKIKLN